MMRDGVEPPRTARLLPGRGREWALAATLAAAYALLGWWTLSIPEGSVELRRMIWLPSGVALAWLMIGGIRQWPGIVVGAGLATALTGGAPLHIAGTAVANTAEAVLGVALLRGAGYDGRFENRRQLVVFLGVLAVCTGLAAAVSVWSLWAAGGLSSGAAPRVWLMWWLTHAMGQVVIVPLALSVPRFGGPPIPRVGAGESIAIIGGLALTLAVSFTPLVPARLSALPITFLPFPFLFWAAYRWGQLGASTASVLAAAFAVTGTLLGVGPFVQASPYASLFLTLVFVCVAEFSTLFIAGLVAERHQAERERERLESRLRRSEKLESLGTLAGGIAHDFNNLLVAIVGNVDLVLMDTDPTDAAYEPLSHSVRASERAADLCRQLLSYAGQGPFDHAVVDLSAVLTDITSILRVAVPPGTTVAYDLAPEPLPVRADTTQLRQVILNLFTNAVEALAGGPGRITLRTRADGDGWADGENTFFLPPPEGAVAILEVEDSGEGIRREHVERIFDPVFTTRGMGRGLGLASVLGIVRAHRGTIHVGSAPAEGTRFTLAFPLLDEPLDPMPAPPIPDASRRTGRVLVVDDEPMVRRAAGALVRRLGYQTVVAEDGRSAIETLERTDGRFACVLLDVTMPGDDGVEVLREMRRRGWRVPVLLSSGSVLEPIDGLADLGPAAFIAKPYTLAALETALGDLLGRG